MKLLNEREQVRSVAAQWRSVYGRSTEFGSDKQEIAATLEALDAETATAETVAEIIGNDSWVKPAKCHECGAETWSAVQVGEEPDYESNTARICLGCLKAAVALLEASLPQQPPQVPAEALRPDAPTALPQEGSSMQEKANG